MGVLRKKLLDGERKIAVWGTGYIGFSTMANFAVNGVSCLGTDIVQSVVDKINAGVIPILNMEYWLGFPIEPLVRTGMIRTTSDWRDLISEEMAVHMIAVPTEKGDEPWDQPLIDVRAGRQSIPQGGRYLCSSFWSGCLPTCGDGGTTHEEGRDSY